MSAFKPKFKKDQRVRISGIGIAETGCSDSLRGMVVVTPLQQWTVTILVDGNKWPTSWSQCFWQVTREKRPAGVL